MTSGSALFDTNILIDLFSGRREAKQALEAWPPQNAISLITWMEVMVGAKKYHQEQRTRMALSTFNIINISQDIAERSVALRQEYKLKLPDAIILATAQLHRLGNDSNLLIVFYVQIVPDDFVMQLHRF